MQRRNGTTRQRQVRRQCRRLREATVGVAGGQHNADRGKAVTARMRALPDRVARQDIRQVRRNGATAQGTAAVTLGVGAHENGGGSHELRAGRLNQLLGVAQG